MKKFLKLSLFSTLLVALVGCKHLKKLDSSQPRFPERPITSPFFATLAKASASAVVFDSFSSLIITQSYLNLCNSNNYIF